MNFASGNRTLYFLARSTGATASRALAGLAFLSVAGCAQLTGPAAETAPPPRAAAPGPMDAVTTFAATARPGAETTLPLDESGRSARVRLLRAYNAASGRECREVLIGGGMEERSRLLCQADGQWAEARPLLRGGGMQRP